MIPRPVLTLRWSPEVILAMAAGPQRFNWMLNGIRGISDRVLTERLRGLEDEHLVEREVDAGPPVAVWYRLTERGEAFVPPLRELARLLTTESQEVAQAV